MKFQNVKSIDTGRLEFHWERGAWTLIIHVLSGPIPVAAPTERLEHRTTIPGTESRQSGKRPGRSLQRQ
jgi:hypothetical protein